jgi:calcium-dependent protein kinase
MGSICTKLCSFFYKNKSGECNQENKNDQEMDNFINDGNTRSQTADVKNDYELICGEEENIQHVEDLQINVAKVVVERKCTPSEMYDLIKELGSGAFGKVCKVQHKQTKELRAMKIISKDLANAGMEYEQIESEINILKRLDHPNILKLFEFFQDDMNYYIVTELCEHGDLFDKLDRMKSMNEIAVKLLMYQILSSVAYLHSKGVIHGDLKLENILIDSLNYQHRTSFNTSVNIDVRNYLQDRSKNVGRPRSKTENSKSSSKSEVGFSQQGTQINYFKNMSNFEIKIIDFGCSKIFNKKQGKISGMIGTSIYCSPEVLQDEYNEKCDVWACGVILYMLLSGFAPFDGETEEEIYEKIKKGKFSFDYPEFKDVSLDAKDLIMKLLTYNADKRISAKQALSHSFFTGEIKPSDSYRDSVDTRVLTDLKKIRKSLKFQQAVVTYISHNFADKEEVNRIRKIFKFLDSNGDGVVSKEELLQGYKSLGEEISEEALDFIIKAIDNDGSGCIEYEEFIRASLDKNKLLTETNLKMAFDLFDIDQSGLISCEEIKQIIFGEKIISDTLIDEFLAQINKTQSDYLSFEDFKFLMNELTEKN